MVWANFHRFSSLRSPNTNDSPPIDAEGNRASGSAYESNNDDDRQEEEEEAHGAEYENDEMTAKVLVEEIDLDAEEVEDGTRPQHSDGFRFDKKPQPIVPAPSGGGEKTAKKHKLPERQRLKQTLQQKRALRKLGAKPKKATKAKR
jgi:hypothetical protein